MNPRVGRSERTVNTDEHITPYRRVTVTRDEQPVGVVVTTRDRRVWLASALACVLAQGDVVREVVVVDDGSTDGTQEWLRRLKDPRITVLQMPGTGVAAARNAGLARVRAPWVAFTDDDDVWAPDKLVSQIAALREQPGSRWAAAGAVLVDEQLSAVGWEWPMERGDVSQVALEKNPVSGGASGTLIDAALVREVGAFDPQFSVLADWDLWIRLAATTTLTVVERPLHAYRLHATTLSSRSAEVERELELLERKHAAQRRAAALSERSPRVHLWMAQRAQRAGMRRVAASAYLRSKRAIGLHRSVLRAAEALIWPAAFRHRDRRRGRRVPPAWVEEVRGWLPEAARWEARQLDVASRRVDDLGSGGSVSGGA